MVNELPCPRHYSCPLSQPLRQPALPFQVATSYSVWHQSCRCFNHTNSGRHADRKHGGPAAVDPAALMLVECCSFGRSLARTNILQACQGKSVGSAASDYACMHVSHACIVAQPRPCKTCTKIPAHWSQACTWRVGHPQHTPQLPVSCRMASSLNLLSSCSVTRPNATQASSYHKESCI